MKKRKTKKTSKSESIGKKYGFRSGLEEQIASELEALGVPYEFESTKIEFTQPAKQRKYTPDFILPNGIIIETKGRFVTSDRQKHLMIQAEHPYLDIRFVFNNSRSKISKQSKTTYGMWCDKYGFLYADKHIPKEWIEEE